MLLGALAVAPAAALLMFVYLRDRYEPEPKRLVAYVFLAGALGILPAVAAESALLSLRPGAGTMYNAFVVAGLVEEVSKWLAVWLVVYSSRQFNEPMDGIVYATAGSLGFATVENLLYVGAGGIGAGVMRAVVAVPGHAFFGVMMGYHLGLAKFALTPAVRRRQFALSLAVPVLLHGAYDALVLSGSLILVWLVVPFVAALWFLALRDIRLAQMGSPFRPPQWRFRGLFRDWRPRQVVRAAPDEPSGSTEQA